MRRSIALALVLVTAACVATPAPSASSAPTPTAAATAASDVRPVPPASARPSPVPPASPAPTVAPPRVLASGGPVPEAGVLFFTDATFTLWRYNGASGALDQVLRGHSIDAEGPQGVYITALSALGIEKVRGPKLVTWDGVIHDDHCRTIHTIVSFRADGACLYLHPEGVFVRTAATEAAVKLLPPEWGAKEVAWSPGGARAAIIRETPSDDRQNPYHSVWLLDPDGSLRMIYDAGKTYPQGIQWSGDGAFVSVRHFAAGASQERVVTIVDTLSLERTTIPDAYWRADRGQWSPWGGFAYEAGTPFETWRGNDLRVRLSYQADPVSFPRAEGPRVALAPAWDPWRGSLAWVAGPASTAANAKSDYLAGRGPGARRAVIARPPLAQAAEIACPAGPVEGVRWSGDGEQLLLLCRRPNTLVGAFELWLQPIADGQAPRGDPQLLVSGLGDPRWVDLGRAESLYSFVGWSRATPPPLPGLRPSDDHGNLGCGPADRVGLPSPARAGCLSYVRGDFDGDGRPDLLMVYADEWVTQRDSSGARREHEGTWKTRIVFGSGRTFVGAIDPPAYEPAAVMAADANGDGHDEAFVMLDHGASTQAWGMYRWDGTTLAPVQLAGSGPLRLAVSGSVTHGGGFSCEDGRLVVLGIADTPPDYDTFSWTRRTLAWDGPGTLREVARSEGTLTASTLAERTRPEFNAFWQARCGQRDPLP